MHLVVGVIGPSSDKSVEQLGLAGIVAPCGQFQGIDGMLRILYFSTASADMSRDDVDSIVRHATKKNATLGITGSLAYNGRNFCQLLEGELGPVMDLIETIQDDPRHAGFKIIDQREVETRAFPDWSMQLVNELDFSTVINAMKA